MDANGNITDSGYNKSDLSRGVGKYIKQGLASVGWYKIYECGAYNEGTAVRIDMGTFFNHQQNSAHVIDLAFGYQNAQMSEVCRDSQRAFTKLRFCYNNSGKNVILVYYNGADSNSAYAHIISAQHSDNAQTFAFVAVDASTYTSYTEYDLGQIGTYINGVKAATQSDVAAITPHIGDVEFNDITIGGNGGLYTLTVAQSIPAGRTILGYQMIDVYVYAGNVIGVPLGDNVRLINISANSITVGTVKIRYLYI